MKFKKMKMNRAIKKMRRKMNKKTVTNKINNNL